MHTGDLHILVKSLSQTEKTYFRKAARFQKLDSRYMRLYRAIENRDAYDDMYIGELFKGEPFLKQLAVAKNYLYHTILKNLIPYSAASNTKGRIDRLLAEAHVLFEKRLYSQARDITLICKKISLKHELFTELLSALELEFNIKAAEQVYDHKSDRLMENIYKVRKEIIKKIGNLYKYDLLQHKFISLLHRYMGSQDRKFVNTIDRMINNSILSDENTALSTIAKMKFNHIHSIYHYVKGNLPESHLFLSREIELLTSKKELMNDRIHILLILLANRLSILLGLRKYRGFPAELDSFKKYLRYPQVKKSPVLRFYVIDFSYMLEIFYMCKTGNFENAIKLATEFTAKLNENKFELGKSDNIEFLNLKAQAYFGCGRFKDALEHINLILNDKEAEENYRNYPLAKIFNLIIHFELQNYDLLEYMVPATYKYLAKRKNLFKYEKLIIDFVRKTPSINEYKELLENFKRLKENVNSLSSDRFEKNALEYFDIISWIESKIEGEPLASVVKSKTAA